MEELWATIPEFPDYEVSSLGHIYNQRYRQMMRTSQNNHGHVKITLRGQNGMRQTRSVALLVAEAFVEPPTHLCDQVVILDGDFTNLVATNLVWRPRWFAWRYTRQLKVDQPLHFKNLSVVNVMTNVEYESIIDAGVAEGLLFQDIWRSTYSKAAIFPYGSVFEVNERV